MRDDLLAAVVRYNTPLDESATVRGLLRAFAEEPWLCGRIRVVVCDNSTDALSPEAVPAGWDYCHMPRNLGIAGAYNHALHTAEAEGRRWLLTLDQDTDVTTDYLAGMCRHAAEVGERAAIAAIAPTITAAGMVASPKRRGVAGELQYPAGECGMAEDEAVVINSGAALRVSALAGIGGYSYAFWLDFSDMYVFHEFHRRGWKVWRAADVSLEHEMTVMDYAGRMRPARLRNMLEAESAFYDLYRSPMENVLHNLQLLGRAVKQRVKYASPEFSRMAWSQLTYRLRSSRAERLQRWQAGAAARMDGTGQAGGA